MRKSTLAFAIAVLVVTSTWGPVVLNLAGFYVPELAFAGFALYLLRSKPEVSRAVRRTIFSPWAVAGVLWLSFVAALGVWRNGSLIGPYSEWRSSVILLYAFLFFFKYGPGGDSTVRWLRRVMIWSLVLDALLVAITLRWPGALGTSTPADYEDHGDAGAFGLGRFALPAVTILGAAYLCARTRAAGLLYLTIALGAGAALGGHRLVLLVTVLCVLFLPLCLGWTRTRLSRAGRWRLGVATLLVVIAGAWLAQAGYVQRYLEDAGAIRYRLVERSVTVIDGFDQVISGNGPSDFGDDAIRISYAYFLYTEWFSLLLPHGLGSRETEGRIEGYTEIRRIFGILEPGNTHDSAILYYSYHHGTIATAFFGALLMTLFGRRLLQAGSWSERVELALLVGGFFLIELIYPSVPGINLCFVEGAVLGNALRRPEPPQQHAPRVAHPPQEAIAS